MLRHPLWPSFVLFVFVGVLAPAPPKFSPRVRGSPTPRARARWSATPPPTCCAALRRLRSAVLRYESRLCRAISRHSTLLTARVRASPAASSHRQTARTFVQSRTTAPLSTSPPAQRRASNCVWLTTLRITATSYDGLSQAQLLTAAPLILSTRRLLRDARAKSALGITSTAPSTPSARSGSYASRPTGARATSTHSCCDAPLTHYFYSIHTTQSRRR